MANASILETLCQQQEKMWKRLDYFRDRNMFSDVCLRGHSGKLLAAHQCVLAAGSTFFENTFTNFAAENRNTSLVVDLGFFADHILEMVMDFLYTGTFIATKNQIKEILKVAELLDIEELIGLCKDQENKTQFNYIKVDSAQSKMADQLAELSKANKNQKELIHNLQLLINQLLAAMTDHGSEELVSNVKTLISSTNFQFGNMSTARQAIQSDADRQDADRQDAATIDQEHRVELFSTIDSELDAVTTKSLEDQDEKPVKSETSINLDYTEDQESNHLESSSDLQRPLSDSLMQTELVHCESVSIKNEELELSQLSENTSNNVEHFVDATLLLNTNESSRDAQHGTEDLKFSTIMHDNLCQTMDVVTENSVDESTFQNEAEVMISSSPTQLETGKGESDEMVQVELQLEGPDGLHQNHVVVMPYHSLLTHGEVDSDMLESILVQNQAGQVVKPRSVQSPNLYTVGAHEIADSGGSVLSISLDEPKRKFRRPTTKSQPENLYCEECNKTFVKHSDLVTHLAKHSIDRPYTCQLCGMGFKYPHNLKNHELRHGEKRHKCKECFKAFHTLPELKNHSKLHSGVKPFKCPICSRLFAQKSNMAMHMRLIHKDLLETRDAERFPCSSCDKKFSTHLDLRRHRYWHTRKLTCMHCDTVFNNRRKLVDHMKIEHNVEGKPISREEEGKNVEQCLMCSRYFFNQGALKAHIENVHQKVKRYKCDEPNCEYEAYYQCEVNMHKKSHENGRPPRKYQSTKKKQGGTEKKYMCCTCGDAFGTFRSLLNHEQKSHNHSQEVTSPIKKEVLDDTAQSSEPHETKPAKQASLSTTEALATFSCEYCHKIFASKQILSRHIQAIHQKVYRYECPQEKCSFQAYFISEIKEHHTKVHRQLVQNNEIPILHKPVQTKLCTFCDKSFNSPILLQKHIEMFHEETG